MLHAETSEAPKPKSDTSVSTSAERFSLPAYECHLSHQSPTREIDSDDFHLHVLDQPSPLLGRVHPVHAFLIQITGFGTHHSRSSSYDIYITKEINGFQTAHESSSRIENPINSCCILRLASH
eukprot:Blabericola_migrator_1__1419@NODE_1371_length_4701_cov_185_446051_g920_i0_p2_GENE_NODE_1371_length_4701_cov_185_446051_g920_i0NODE_1371_length_4701_cov_185_446051_g920_i0_p2_ORF_typecomplete_len123_score8_79_NODE_1371_length_4701_cov_185_446051_g920_i0476844